MLNSFSLKGFRSWDERTAIDLAPLTILAGANNVGKSSVIGALLALVQSEHAASGDILLLTGEWVELGPFAELLAPSSTEGFSIGVVGSRDARPIDVVWDFRAADDRDQTMARLHRVEALVGPDGQDAVTLVRSTEGIQRERDGRPADIVVMPHPGAYRSTTGSNAGSLVPLLPFSPGQVLPIGPYRAPPQRMSPYRPGPAGPVVGRYGEYAAQVYYEHRQRETDVLPPTRSQGGARDTFIRALDAWWQFVLEAEVGVHVEELRRIGFVAKVDTPGADNLSFAQVGFGLSQLWPILVAALASRPGDLVIVETPEAHLHPAAQHRIASLFVELARHGRQVIVETHSEYVVTATCLAVKEETLAPEQLALHFFTQVNGQTAAERIPVEKSGRRLKAPEGFFDQASRDLIRLLG